MDLSRHVIAQRHSYLPICPNRPVISESTWARLCGTYISETAEWISTIRSSMELSIPVFVQHYGHLTLTIDVQDQVYKCCIPEMGGLIDTERKGYESIGCYTYFMILSYDLDLGFLKCCISEMGRLIDMEPKGCELIGC